MLLSLISSAAGLVTKLMEARFNASLSERVHQVCQQARLRERCHCGLFRMRTSSCATYSCPTTNASNLQETSHLAPKKCCSILVSLWHGSQLVWRRAPVKQLSSTLSNVFNSEKLWLENSSSRLNWSNVWLSFSRAFLCACRFRGFTTVETSHLDVSLWSKQHAPKTAVKLPQCLVM